MSWIEDRIADRKMLEEHEQQVANRKRAISEQAETVFCDLWTETKAVLKEFESGGLASYPSETPKQKVVRRAGKMKPGMSSHPGHEIQISLAEDRQSISVSEDVNLHFQLDLSDDDVVFMRLAGEPIFSRDAANKILDQFYFPDLQLPKI